MEKHVWASQKGKTPSGNKQIDELEAILSRRSQDITLFLAGDVMTGRGIDQVLPHPSDPLIYEPYMRSAYGYVELAEQTNGLIPKPVDDSYIWGDALAVLDTVKPDLRIINLETSVTKSDVYWPDKGINYRMHPGNIGCLTAARLDCCVLANNHVLDWGHAGLVETLAVLEQAGIKGVGAGRDRQQSQTPAVLAIPGKGRVLIFAYGSGTSGVPPSWAATDERPGVNVLSDLSEQTVLHIKKDIAAIKEPGDLVLVSLHWGGNWGYAISPMESNFAHKLIDDAGVDVIYGHSSHHAKGIEVYQNRLILYGCGDFLNDYEGIEGDEQYRDDLTLMYFPSFEPSTGRLVSMRMIPMQIRRFQAINAKPDDSQWLLRVLNREGKQFGTRLLPAKDGSFALNWE
ncbi:MAG: CapA family protein [Proteobacteria bacterium]|nr:CapA family protein [Pseudomonadota bacterium]MBU1649301.1 CapA family protein [Pseudomonadota bacterium]